MDKFTEKQLQLIDLILTNVSLEGFLNITQELEVRRIIKKIEKKMKKYGKN